MLQSLTEPNLTRLCRAMFSNSLIGGTSPLDPRDPMDPQEPLDPLDTLHSPPVGPVESLDK